MSLFQDRRICQDVNFWQLNVYPQAGGAAVDGKVSIASSSTQVKGVPDQEWAITTSSEDGHLRVTGQASGPSPAVDAFDIAPNGGVSFPAQVPIQFHSQLQVNNGQTNVDGQSAASLSLLSNNPGGNYFTLYCSNGTAGGLTDGHCHLYSYADGTTPQNVIDITPQTAAAGPRINLNGAVNVGGSFTVNGVAPGGGSTTVSKQYAVPSQPDINVPASSPATIYAFDLTGCSGKTTYTVTVDRLQIGQLTTPSGSPVAISFYLIDTSGGVYDATKACLSYPSAGITNGNSAAMAPMTFVFTGLAPPGGLFLVAAQQGASYGCILKGVTFNAAMVAA